MALNIECGGAVVHPVADGRKVVTIRRRLDRLFDLLVGDGERSTKKSVTARLPLAQE